jgi:nucleoside-diphosphate-sugar epimerase
MIPGGLLATVLVVGATGMTGRSVVEQLLANGHTTRIIARSPNKLSAELLSNPDLAVFEASILDVSAEDLSRYVEECDAVISCLGHVLNFKGIYGEPRKLCTDAVRLLCNAIQSHTDAKSTKFILMNTVGVSNPELEEPRLWYDQMVLLLLRYLLPPHRDNETAAEYLMNSIGRNRRQIEWCSVRPDSLIDAELSSYVIQDSPSTGIFSGRPTTRSNVARFMMELVEDDALWETWKYRMPVIMNSK